MFGFLNVYKPKGKTSHDVVAFLRRVTKIKQIGHTGTLDPFAEGVLPICIGKATRLIEYLDDDKAYIGKVQFGSSTDTYDVEGKVTNSSFLKISKEELEKVLINFRGEIEQIPPIYSALKVNGKKLYEYARSGEEVEIKPRKVIINKLELNNFDFDNQTADLYIECSKGTYIRSIANDLGESLGCFGHLSSLKRIKAGKFLIENSVKLDELIDVISVKNNLINPIEYLNMPTYELSQKELEAVSHGNPININRQNCFITFLSNEKLIAIAEVTNNTAKCKKVFI